MKQWEKEIEMIRQTLDDIKHNTVYKNYNSESSVYRKVAWTAFPCILGIHGRLDTLRKTLQNLDKERK